MKRILACALSAALILPAAELPITRVVIYKNGVAYFERGGEIPANEPARLDFKASEMDDVLKSLVVEDSSGGVRQVRYELNEPLEKKLAGIGVQIPGQQPLALLLDQWRGARVEMRYRGENLKGAILSGRIGMLQQGAQRQEVNLLLDSGELRLVMLEDAASLKFEDARLQQQLKDALLAISQSRSTEKRSVFIDTVGQGARKLSARYLTPAPIWKSSYRLTLPDSGEPTLEGWAIVDNDTGEDWNNVELTVVSGRPVSFLSRLYDPRYLNRPEATLPGEAPVAPVLYEGELRKDSNEIAADAVEGQVRSKAVGGRFAMAAAEAAAPPPPPPAPMMMSRVAATALAQELGELFEYRFAAPVSASKGQSLLLPFVQQKIEVKKLLVYSDRSSQHPRAAAEITNSTGKTLDGGPITVYQSNAYAGEALMETLKESDKRLISYAVDLGTRVTTNFESGSQTVRKVTARRGVLTSTTAVEQTTTYTISNVDGKVKTLLVEHPVTPQLKLVSPKAEETTANRYRFNVSLAAKGSGKLAVAEEREIESTVMVSSMTPDVLLIFLQNKALSPAGRKQLEAIAAKKVEVATVDRQQRETVNEITEITRDQDRIRQNLNSLNRVAGQQEQVQRYVGELAKGDARLAQLRDRQAGLQKQRTALDTELNSLIEKLEF